MISYLQGKVFERNNGYITLLNNNVGFEIFILENSDCKENDIVEFFIKTIVKEDDISLYGFATKQEKQLFEKLLLVSGIGPKAAMNILSSISPELLIEAIINKDIEKMTRVKGIGKKGAEKMIFNLKDKFDKEKQITVSKGIDQKSNELVQSLVFLGYDQELANKIVDKVYDSNKTINELIKISLLELKK